MNNELESFVRPFQTNDVTPAQTYYNYGQIGVPNLILRLGRSGSGKMLNGSYSNMMTVYCGQAEVETQEGGGEGEGEGES